jgi:hypothetical protein
MDSPPLFLAGGFLFIGEVDNCGLDERRDTFRNVCATMEIKTTEITEEKQKDQKNHREQQSMKDRI